MIAHLGDTSDDFSSERQELNSDNNLDDSKDLEGNENSAGQDENIVVAGEKCFITCSGCNRTFSAHSGILKCKSCIAQDKVNSQQQVDGNNDLRYFLSVF